MFNTRTFSFGCTSAIVTSMGVIIGLGAATARTATIVSSLLIFAVPDNISDSPSIHMHQAAERLDERSASRATLTNFVARLLIALSFVMIVMLLAYPYAGIVGLVWGFLLLTGVSYTLALARGVSTMPEIGKHLGVAVLVIAASRAIGSWNFLHVNAG
jgi:hypothetical protein